MTRTANSGATVDAQAQRSRACRLAMTTFSPSGRCVPFAGVQTIARFHSKLSDAHPRGSVPAGGCSSALNGERRERARQHIMDGAVTAAYRADRGMVIKLLNEALATSLPVSQQSLTQRRGDATETR